VGKFATDITREAKAAAKGKNPKTNYDRGKEVEDQHYLNKR
jgi:hypothetical protein